MKTLNLLATLFLIITLFANCETGSQTAENTSYSYSIPPSGNSWVIDNSSKDQEVILPDDIQNWSDEDVKIRTYFRVENTGKLHLGMVASSPGGPSTIKVSCDNFAQNIEVNNTVSDTIAIGTVKIDEPGYHYIEIEGVEKTAANFPEIESFLIGGEATQGQVHFVKDEFYWGRRGPSVHLNYQLPENADNIRYFYNEVTVPENNDVMGSYFMACGFGQGYFGMQVNSPTERRILFSVWSPFQTDNPEEIPEEDRIVLLKKGEDVYTGEFGNEGSGGQSFLRYNWKAGNTYRFLLKGVPTGNGETDFTAWFFAPEENEWRLIASFRRPKTDTYLTRLHSFLENFIPYTGNLERKGYYSNQWFYDASNQWTEITKVKFTADNTARKGNRLDYAGGAENSAFFLKNCGFFNETTPIDSFFERGKSNEAPDIDFSKLP